MPSLIQNISNNPSQRYYIYPADFGQNSRKKLPETTQPVQKTKTKTEHSDAVVVFETLTGIAGLFGILWGMRNGYIPILFKRKPTKAELTQMIKDANDRIADLKNLLSHEIRIRRRGILRRCNNFTEYDYRLPFKSGGELLRDTNERLARFNRNKEAVEKIRKEQWAEIKSNFSRLLKDPEFQELRTTRKALREAVFARRSPDEVKISNKKIRLVNDLMINRVYPEEKEKYFRIYGITDEQAFELVRTKFKTLDEFVNKYESIREMNYSFDFNCPLNRFDHNFKLRIRDVFPKEERIISTGLEVVKESGIEYHASQMLYNKYIGQIKELINEMRGIPETLEYKALLRKVKTMKEELAKMP